MKKLAVLLLIAFAAGTVAFAAAPTTPAPKAPKGKVVSMKKLGKKHLGKKLGKKPTVAAPVATK